MEAVAVAMDALAATPVSLLRGMVALGFLVSLLAEWRVHRRNYQFLAGAGAEERGPVLMRLYYGGYAALLPLVLAEWRLLPENVTRATLAAGLLLVLVGQGLRLWAIAALGQRWSMRCLAVPGLRFTNRGPYRWLRDPEYLARALDGTGLCLVFGAVGCLLIFISMTALLVRAIQACERQQVEEVAHWRPDWSSQSVDH